MMPAADIPQSQPLRRRIHAQLKKRGTTCAAGSGSAMTNPCAASTTSSHRKSCVAYLLINSVMIWNTVQVYMEEVVTQLQRERQRAPPKTSDSYRRSATSIALPWALLPSARPNKAGSWAPPVTRRGLA